MPLTDDEMRRYLEELRRMGMPEEFRDHLRRLRTLEEMGTPEETRAIIRALGSLERITKRDADLHEMLETQRFVVRLLKSIGWTARYLAILLGGWLAYKAFIAEFFGKGFP